MSVSLPVSVHVAWSATLAGMLGCASVSGISLDRCMIPVGAALIGSRQVLHLAEVGTHSFVNIEWIAIAESVSNFDSNAPEECTEANKRFPIVVGIEADVGLRKLRPDVIR